MTIRTYNKNEQERKAKKGDIYKTLKEARAAAKQYNEYEAVRALDLYTRKHIGYTVEHV